MITYDTGFGNLKTAGLESAKRIIRLRDKYSMFRVNLLLLLCIFVCFQVWFNIAGSSTVCCIKCTCLR